jgi:protein-tyrosine phosphatase
VLFICNGNICRSPIAAALLIKKYEENGINAKVSSAGFESFNINEGPDPLALKIAKTHGLKLDHCARIFMKTDFNEFDKIYVMDTRNYRDVKDLAKKKTDLEKIDYLMNTIEPGSNKTIPDPFQSGIHSFDQIFVLLDKATDKIVEIAKKN